MQTPKVSILVPNLNNNKYLHERMTSIKAQNTQDYEIIIYDSYSNDGSWEYLKQYQSDRRVHLFQGPAKGVYDAWNVLVRRATGQFVYIATSDDTMYPDFLGKTTDILLHNEDVDLCVTKLDIIDETSRIVNNNWNINANSRFYKAYSSYSHKRNGTTEFFMHWLLGFPYISITSLLIRRSLYDKVGYYPTDAGTLGDKEWLMRSCLKTDIISVPEILATWRIRSKQASRSVKLEILNENERKVVKRTVSAYKNIIEKRTGKSVAELFTIVGEDSPYVAKRKMMADPTNNLMGKCKIAADLFLHHPYQFVLDMAYKSNNSSYCSMLTINRANKVIETLGLLNPQKLCPI